MECNVITDQCTSHLGRTSGGGKPAVAKPVGGVVGGDAAASDTGVEDDKGRDGIDAGAMSPLDDWARSRRPPPDEPTLTAMASHPWPTLAILDVASKPNVRKPR